mmetsp:Transcript_99609/g.251300  ORF Transcript_99609/g.251300 Transcript_99609/m.251300 type:complete len:202 (-) Transcript_99609:15-620(-)
MATTAGWPGLACGMWRSHRSGRARQQLRQAPTAQSAARLLLQKAQRSSSSTSPSAEETPSTSEFSKMLSSLRPVLPVLSDHSSSSWSVTCLRHRIAYRPWFATQHTAHALKAQSAARMLGQNAHLPIERKSSAMFHKSADSNVAATTPSLGSGGVGAGGACGDGCCCGRCGCANGSGGSAARQVGHAGVGAVQSHLVMQAR